MMSTNTMETWTAAAKFALDWFYCLYLWHCGAVKGAVAWNVAKFNWVVLQQRSQVGLLVPITYA